VLWIRIGFDANPDPAFLVNEDPDADPPDPDTHPVPGFNEQKLGKI
jgi:hypothetical protein